MKFNEGLRDEALVRALGSHLGQGVKILDFVPASGGCIHRAGRLETSRGAFVFKWNPGVDGDMFAAEAAGLEALRSAESGLVIPEVIGHSTHRPGWILMQCLDAATPDANTWKALGLGLARLHSCGAGAFGFHRTTYCGTTPQSNRTGSSWAAFYANRRLFPLLRAMRDAGQVTGAQSLRYETLLGRLEEILDPGVPALIHGDLWPGNFLATSQGPALVDPAVYYAHREAEFGIFTLFGGFPPEVFERYTAEAPLPPGWEERLPLYQLYHLMNHACLFAGEYIARANAVADRFGN